MKQQSISLRKALNPIFIKKAMRSFDRATTMIVSLSWGGALAVLLFALYTVNMAMHARKGVDAAQAMEPSVPEIRKSALNEKELRPLEERLTRRFAGISFTVGNDRSLTVVSNDSGQFRNWLTVLNYIDTITPEYRWQIKTFCVGSLCPGSAPMRALLTGQKVSFVARQTDKE